MGLKRTKIGWDRPKNPTIALNRPKSTVDRRSRGSGTINGPDRMAEQVGRTGADALQRVGVTPSSSQGKQAGGSSVSDRTRGGSGESTVKPEAREEPRSKPGLRSVFQQCLQLQL